jgi:hypothetical protein
VNSLFYNLPPVQLVSRIEAFESLELQELGDLLYEIEMAHIDEHDLRLRLEGVLLAVAIKLRGNPDPVANLALWSALRRFGSLVRTSTCLIDRLVEFLRPEDDVMTRMAALHCVGAIFYLESPSEDRRALRERIEELVDSYFSADLNPRASMCALAATAIVALSALIPVRTSDLARRVRDLGRPGVSALVRSSWNEMADARSVDSELFRRGAALIGTENRP